MSGGSWDYICYKIEEAATKLEGANCPYRQQVGQRLRPFVKVLHDIEWADSCDYSQSDAMKSILEFLTVTPEEYNTEYMTRKALLRIVAKGLDLEGEVTE